MAFVCVCSTRIVGSDICLDPLSECLIDCLNDKIRLVEQDVVTSEGGNTPACGNSMCVALEHPAYWCQRFVQRGADGRILPDVPESRPLDPGIDAD